MTSEVKAILEELIMQMRSENLPLEQVFLFGAYSTDKFNEHSRIDTAIVLSEIQDNDINLAQKELNKIKRKVDFRLEVYPFEDVNFNMNDPFAAEILKTGIKIL